MSRSALLSKSATKFSVFVSAIVGSLFAASLLPSGAGAETKLMQLTDSRSPKSETAEVNRVAVLALAFGGSAALCLELNKVLDHNGSSPAAVRLPANVPFQPRSSSLSFNQASRSLQSRLLRLLHEDRALANRLFAQASLKYPGKAPNWYVEKVIYDLERDRGKY